MLNRNVIEGIDGLCELIMNEIREHLVEECDGGPVDIDVELDMFDKERGHYTEYLRSVQLSDDGETVLVTTDSGVNELELYSLDEKIKVVDAL